MAKFKIKFDKEKCIGCGTCAAICPGNWEMKEEGKAHPIKEEVEDLGCNQTAAESCPAGAIEVEPVSEKKE